MTSKAKEPVPPPSPEATVAEAKRLVDLVPKRTSAAIVSVIDRDPHRGARQRALAGTYRCLVSYCIAVPRSERLIPGTSEVDPHLPSIIYAEPGDCIWLDDVDAAFAIDNDLVEVLDARPSKVGRPSAMEIATSKKEAWDFATVRRLAEERGLPLRPSPDRTGYVGPSPVGGRR